MLDRFLAATRLFLLPPVQTSFQGAASTHTTVHGKIRSLREIDLGRPNGVNGAVLEVAVGWIRTKNGYNKYVGKKCMFWYPLASNFDLLRRGDEVVLLADGRSADGLHIADRVHFKLDPQVHHKEEWADTVPNVKPA